MLHSDWVTLHSERGFQVDFPHAAALRGFSANEKKGKPERFKANQRHTGPEFRLQMWNKEIEVCHLCWKMARPMVLAQRSLRVQVPSDALLPHPPHCSVTSYPWIISRDILMGLLFRCGKKTPPYKFPLTSLYWLFSPWLTLSFKEIWRKVSSRHIVTLNKLILISDACGHCYGAWIWTGSQPRPRSAPTARWGGEPKPTTLRLLRLARAAGLFASQHVESLPTRDRTHVSRIGRQILHRWAPREALLPSPNLSWMYFLKWLIVNVCSRITVTKLSWIWILRSFRNLSPVLTLRWTYLFAFWWQK